MLTLPLPLRPEQRLSHLIGSLTLTQTHHVRLDELVQLVSKSDVQRGDDSAGIPTAQQQRFLLTNTYENTMFSGLHDHTFKQLRLFDEETLQLHWLYEFICGIDTEREECTPLKETPKMMPGRAPPPVPTRNASSNAAHQRQTSSSVVRVHAAPIVQHGHTCSLMLLRLILHTRLPNHLLQLLKWILSARRELVEQKEEYESEEEEVLMPEKREGVEKWKKQVERIVMQFNLMEEICWKLLFRLEQILRFDILTRCECHIPNHHQQENRLLSSAWWHQDCTIRAMRVVTTNELLSEAAIYSLIDMILGDTNLFQLQSILNPSASKHPTMKIGVLQHVELVSPFLFALSKTTSHEITHQGLEWLTVMCVQVRENEERILRHCPSDVAESWKSTIVPLMLYEGLDPSSLTARSLVHDTLCDIIASQQEGGGDNSHRTSLSGTTSTMQTRPHSNSSSCNSVTSGNGVTTTNNSSASSTASSVASSLTNSTSSSLTSSKASSKASSRHHTCEITLEYLVERNVKLALGLWVLLHFGIFKAPIMSHEEDEQEGSDATPAAAEFRLFLYDSFDRLEDHAGWMPHTILVIRVLLVSLLTKITGTQTHKRMFRNDVHHPSWSCLFDLLTVCENFMFYSPLIPSSEPLQQTATMNATPAVPIQTRNVRSRFDQQHNSHRRTSSATSILPPKHPNSIGSDLTTHLTSSTASTTTTYLSRAKDSRRFKSVGLHMDLITGQCDDEILVEKITELLDSLKIHELDSCLDSTADTTDRERMKKLKKRGLFDVEFFGATRAYFYALHNKKTSSATSSPSLTAMNSHHGGGTVRSLPELLQKRNAQRESSGGRLSSMFQNLTRHARLRSMEEKLNNSSSCNSGNNSASHSKTNSAASSKNNSLTKKNQAELEQHYEKLRENFAAITSTRYQNMSTRLKHGLHSGTSSFHAKLHLELVKLKIESKYNCVRGGQQQQQVMEVESSLQQIFQEQYQEILQPPSTFTQPSLQQQHHHQRGIGASASSSSLFKHPPPVPSHQSSSSVQLPSSSSPSPSPSPSPPPVPKRPPPSIFQLVNNKKKDVEQIKQKLQSHRTSPVLNTRIIHHAQSASSDASAAACLSPRTPPIPKKVVPLTELKHLASRPLPPPPLTNSALLSVPETKAVIVSPTRALIAGRVRRNSLGLRS